MKFVILIHLLYVADCCSDFWNNWEGFPCASSNAYTKIRCYKTKMLSYAQIINKHLLLHCKNENIYPELMRCLEANDVDFVATNNCYMWNFQFRQFFSGVEVTDTLIYFNTNVENFYSATFNDIPSLKAITLTGARTSGLLNLTFDKVPSMTYLDIADIKFDTFLRRPFQNLTNLIALKIRNGILKTLPDELFYGLYNLQKLDLQKNQIEEISPLHFRNLTQLEYLNLSDNKLTNLSSDLLSDLSNLQVFYIENNRLNTLPENLLVSCPKLAFFDVSRNQINQFPPGFFNGLPDLKYMAAIDCGLANIEDIFSDAHNLTELYLTRNNILHLPSELFKNSTKLKIFYVGMNKIQYLSSDFFHDLIHLIDIQLNRNDLQTLPENAFQNLSSLEVLDLSFNRFTYLPENIFLPLIKLKVLTISYNSLSRFPADHPFGKSKYLTRIFAKNLNLIVWPKINWTAHNLTIVDFSENNFSAVRLPIFTPNRMIVNLTHSDISTIYIDTWRYGFNNPIYDLTNNNITCLCQSRLFNDFTNTNLETLLSVYPNVNNFQCYKENKKLLDIWPTNTVCPVKEDCPVNCKCFLDYRGILVNCSGKGLKNLPVINSGNASVVDLRWNEIHEVPSMKWSNAIHLYLSNNQITDIEDLPPKVVYLSLHNNRLSQLHESLMNHVDEVNEFKISLSGNNWRCDCGSGFTMEWLIRNRHKILDFSNVSCRMDSDLFTFEQVISSHKCEKRAINFATWKIAVLCVGLIILILILLAVFAYFWRKEKAFKTTEANPNNSIDCNVYT